MNFKLLALSYLNFHELPFYIFLALSLASSLVSVSTHSILELYKPTYVFKYVMLSYISVTVLKQRAFGTRDAASPPLLPSACTIFIHLSNLDQPLGKIFSDPCRIE